MWVCSIVRLTRLMGLIGRWEWGWEWDWMNGGWIGRAQVCSRVARATEAAPSPENFFLAGAAIE